MKLLTLNNAGPYWWDQQCSFAQPDERCRSLQVHDGVWMNSCLISFNFSLRFPFDFPGMVSIVRWFMYLGSSMGFCWTIQGSGQLLRPWKSSWVWLRLVWKFRFWKILNAIVCFLIIILPFDGFRLHISRRRLTGCSTGSMWVTVYVYKCLGFNYECLKIKF